MSNVIIKDPAVPTGFATAPPPATSPSPSPGSTVAQAGPAQPGTQPGIETSFEVGRIVDAKGTIEAGVPSDFDPSDFGSNGSSGRSEPSKIWTPPAKRALPVFASEADARASDRERDASVTPESGGVKSEDMKAIAAGRVCRSCRHFRYEEGQRRHAKEKLYQGIVRELAWKPHWWNPADYGACVAHPRDAVHRDATCPDFQPVGKLVSFFGKLTSR